MSTVSRQNSIVTQSNKLIESRYTLTISEQRLVITLISFISPEDEDFKDYEIKISDFQKILDIKSNSIYSNIQDLLNKLASRVINIPKENGGFLITHWFSSAEYEPEEGKIKISFDKKLKPYLLKLKEQFTQYRLFTVAQFQGSYTVRIYMLLKQYEKIGFREIDLIELRKILNIEDKKYKEFKEFKRNVITQAKKEFEKKDENGHVKSDITFDLETIRTGRKITRLRFNIRKQKYQERLPFDIPEAETLTPAVQALVDHKINENYARKFEAEQGSEEVLRCVSQYEEKVKNGKVSDTNGGYLLAMLEGRAGKQSKAELDKEDRKQKERIAEQKKVDEEAKRTAEKQALNEKIALFLEELNEEQQKSLIEDFEASEIFETQVKNNVFVSERYKIEGVGCVMVSPAYKRFINEKYL